MLSRTYVVPVPNDAVLQVGAVAYARTGEQDAPLDLGRRPNPAVAPYRGVPDQGHTPTHNRVLPDQHPALKGGGRMKSGTPTSPKIFLSGAGNPYPYLPGEHVVLGLPVGLQRPDVRPVEVTLVADKALRSLQELRKDVLGEVE